MSKSKSVNKIKRNKSNVERKPFIQEFDSDGNLIGDDGYEMTPSRKRMHRVFDAFFIIGLIAALICVACIVVSYFQGQDYSYLELQASGGTMLNGWEIALLLRVEALYCLTLAIILISMSVVGFHWLYDQGSSRVLFIALIGEALVSFGVLFFSLLAVHLFEPISFLSIIVICYALICMKQVSAERPHLRKPKVANRIVKK